MWTLQKWMVVFVNDKKELDFVTPADSIDKIIHGHQRAFTSKYPSLIYIGGYGTEKHKMLRVLWDPDNCKY